MGSLGELLATRRRRRFVGRAAEKELFRAALAASEAPFAVLHVHGPGGLGKTSLMDVFAALAEEAGARVVRLDGRDLVPSPASLLAALRALVDGPEGLVGDRLPSAGLADDAPISASERLVVLIDSYEHLAPLDDWLRTRLLPRFSTSALTVIAGRMPPAAAWRADPGWRDLLRVVTLRNLDPEDGREYLEAHGVAPALHDRLLELSHGHPLGLSLLVDLMARGGDAPVDPLTPDLVGVLLTRFVDTVPSGPERRALEVCALARVTTESLLRAALGAESAHELFRWLIEVSFIETGPDGVFPHDLARDILDADLRWRDPEAYRQIFRNVAAHVRARLRSSHGSEQQRTIRDLKFLFRNLPGILSPIDWDAWGHHDPEPARAEDPTRPGRRLHAAAAHDARLGTAFVRVSGLVDDPAALLNPRVALHVLRSSSGEARCSDAPT
ncbi:MAG TPA: AAA family ATPase [Polyangiaceae bacterium]